MKIESIDTNYAGYNFRSRLEARWAVFFNAMNWDYLYEPQGYTLPNGTKYLPDFYLPKFQTFAEVKFDVLEVFDYKRARSLVESTRIPLLILDSDPSYKFFTQITVNDDDEIELRKINLIEDKDSPGKLLINRMFVSEEDYQEYGNVEPIACIKEARKHRFGIFD